MSVLGPMEKSRLIDQVQVNDWEGSNKVGESKAVMAQCAKEWLSGKRIHASGQFIARRGK